MAKAPIYGDPEYYRVIGQKGGAVRKAQNPDYSALAASSHKNRTEYHGGRPKGSKNKKKALPAALCACGKRKQEYEPGTAFYPLECAECREEMKRQRPEWADFTLADFERMAEKQQREIQQMAGKARNRRR